MEQDHLIIEIAQQPATALYACLNELTVELDEQLAGWFKLHLTLVHRSDGSWYYLDEAALEIFSEVKISVQFEDQAAEELFLGYITHIKPRFEADLSQCYLEIWGMDKSILLDRQEKLIAWSDQTDSDIAHQIWNSYGLTPVVDTTSIKHDETVSTIIQRETDMQFLKRLARRNGFECFVEGNSGYFRQPDLTSSPQPVLSAHFQEHTNLTQFHVEANALFPAQAITMYQANPADKNQPFKAEITAAQRGQQPALGRITADGLPTNPIEPSHLYPSREVTTGQPELEALCQSHFHQAEWFITGEGQIAANQYGHVLKPRRTVTIRGVSELYSGHYYVTRVTHTFTRTGYTQSFRVKRNALEFTG